MAWIDVIGEDAANDELKNVFDELCMKRGKVSNILKVHSLLPQTMKSHLDLYLSIMFNKSHLKREDKELLAVIVSIVNDCPYCISHHVEALLHYWKDQSKIDRLINSMDFSDLSDSQKILANFAVKLSRNPGTNNEDDVKQLRKVSFSDKEILEIVLIISYFNFVNRIALGLGVEFSDEEKKGYHY